MKIGDRVGAILSLNGNVALFLGYGVYEGDSIPPPEVPGFLAEMCRELQRSNPTILLDNNTRVYGCECWWGSEKEVQKRLEGCHVEMTDVDLYRARAKE